MRQDIKETFKYCFTGPLYIYPLLGVIAGTLFYWFCFDTVRPLIDDPIKNAATWSVIVALLLSFISLFGSIWFVFTEELIADGIIDEKWYKRVRNTGVLIYYIAATLCLIYFDLPRADNILGIIIPLYGAIGYAWAELCLKLKRINSN